MVNEVEQEQKGNGMPATRVLVIEDDPTTREVLRRYLTRAGLDVTEADDGTSGLEAATHGSPDLVILDLMLPGIDGLDVCERIRRTSAVPIMILTALGSESDRVVGLELGADDYVVKPFAFAELLARVRTLLRRGASTMVESQFQAADLFVDLVSRKVTRGGTRITLTSKEFTLLEFFLRHQGEVLPRSLIASQVWDMNFDSDTNAIDVAVKRLRAKIDNDFEPKLIQTVRGVGYMLEVPDVE